MTPYDDLFSELPPEAYSDPSAHEISDDWLSTAEEGEQIAAIAAWFNARFWDPAHETPYVSAEGGYIWIHGGPFDASEQLYGRFEGIVPNDLIDVAVELLERDGVYEWAPTDLTYYDRLNDVVVDERSEPMRALETRLARLRSVLALQGAENARSEVRKLAFAGVIAALESFLWETMAYFVEHREETISGLVTGLPLFRDEKIKLGDIYRTTETLKTKVKAHLQHVVWHRADSVAPLFKYGLGVTLGFVGFSGALQKRHDIVHRSGHDVEGRVVLVQDDEVISLASQVLAFANELDARITSALPPRSDTAHDF